MSEASSSPLIGSSLDNGVLTITIQRPEKKNALTVAMYAALTDLLQNADGNDSVRVLLIHGAGDAFTAGNDLKDFLAAPPTDESSPVIQFLQALCEIRKPMIAAVHGAAVGIGTTLLLHCDLAYAAESAKFQLPFVNLGLCPEAASTYLLPLMAGHQRAAELLLLGEPFSALEAERVGLINRVLPGSEVLDAARQTARQLAAKPQASVLVTKKLMKQHYDDAVRKALAAEVLAFYERVRSPEAAEAMAAFFEKRKPDFSKLQ
jgi:enoyl-CoA hydratase/carnithine racemase